MAGPFNQAKSPTHCRLHQCPQESQLHAEYPVTSRNRLRRRHERGHYDHETVHAILDAAMVCHIAYVIDGQPFCTPTSFWREGERLYWHGSSASRMIRAQAKGMPVCVTVTHHDALVLARSGFHHSVNYRCAMAYGQARAVTDPAAKLRAMNAFVDRFYPGRTAALRPPTAQEIKAIDIVEMQIDDAAAKIRSTGVARRGGGLCGTCMVRCAAVANRARRTGGMRPPVGWRDTRGRRSGKLCAGSAFRRGDAGNLREVVSGRLARLLCHCEARRAEAISIEIASSRCSSQ
jgi:uncharacterized protein